MKKISVAIVMMIITILAVSQLSSCRNLPNDMNEDPTLKKAQLFSWNSSPNDAYNRGIFASNHHPNRVTPGGPNKLHN
ncbi:hypothetical protein M5689_008049 [Euphorbia peplus]|nr:hypothetical protein M5689_008049 [Euphorbia peplus]